MGKFSHSKCLTESGYYSSHRLDTPIPIKGLSNVNKGLIGRHWLVCGTAVSTGWTEPIWDYNSHSKPLSNRPSQQCLSNEIDYLVTGNSIHVPTLILNVNTFFHYNNAIIYFRSSKYRLKIEQRTMFVITNLLTRLLINPYWYENGSGDESKFS